MSCQFNARRLCAGRFRRFADNLARAGGQISAVPVKEHQEAPHRSGCSNGGGCNTRRIEGITQPKQEGLVAAFRICLA